MATTGTVKWYNNEKGFGFITPDDGSKDCFVQHTSIQADGYRSIQDNDRVQFNIVQGQKGPVAENVHKIG